MSTTPAGVETEHLAPLPLRHPGSQPPRGRPSGSEAEARFYGIRPLHPRRRSVDAEVAEHLGPVADWSHTCWTLLCGPLPRPRGPLSAAAPRHVEELPAVQGDVCLGTALFVHGPQAVVPVVDEMREPQGLGDATLPVDSE